MTHLSADTEQAYSVYVKRACVIAMQTYSRHRVDTPREMPAANLVKNT